MKQLTKISLIVIASLLFATCHKYPRKGESGNHGDIIDNYTAPDCYYPRTGGNSEYIIKSFTDLDTNGASYGCVRGQPNLDFNTYSVIGKGIFGACRLKIRREVTIDHDQKKYLYKITYKDQGTCKKLAFHNNLVVVPKIPNDYTVVFEVEEDGLFK